jgi:hypothetical protein
VPWLTVGNAGALKLIDDRSEFSDIRLNGK